MRAMAGRWSAEWRRVDGRGTDRVLLETTFRGWRIRGELTGPPEEGSGRVRYEIGADSVWRTRRVKVERLGAGLSHTLRLRSDGAGAWVRDGSRAPELAGCTEVDLEASPSTNLLPIRRLALPIGGSAEVLAAWVRLPQLSVEPLRQRYTRIAPWSYRYESPRSGFTADLDVDDVGLVLRYPGFWERASGAPPNP